MTCMMGDDRRPRCGWCNLNNPAYVAYHDTEWGVPTRDDGRLFEMLMLEPFQAGLSWETILNKRGNFRRAFDGYSIERICAYGEAKVAELMGDSGIIRNRRKIEAAINNAQVFRSMQATEQGGFAGYIWRFTDGRVIHETGKSTSVLSDAVAADLKSRGMRFIGSTTAYAYLQSIGVIRSHEPGCFLYGDGGGAVAVR